MRVIRRRNWFITGSCLPILVAPVALYAAEAQTVSDQPSAGAENVSSAAEARVTLQEVVVTAQKRRESLQNVPVAVVAFGRTELDNSLATDLSTIAELAPQVLIGTSPSGTGALITIRGISTSAADAGLDQSVSASIDGVSMSRGRIVDVTQFDLQQVEVLEGPQALFFGKNSPAGVISLESADPTSSPSGYVKAGYEYEAAEKWGEMAISGPIAGGLQARLAFKYDYMDGWLKNVAPAEANPFQPSAPLPGAAGETIAPRATNYAGRLTLLWQPADDFTAKLKLTLGSETSNDADGNKETFCGGGQTVQTILGVPETHSSCAINMERDVSNLPAVFAVNYPYGNGGVPLATDNLGLASLSLEKRFDDLTITSVTGYYDQNDMNAYPAENSEFTQIYDVQGERYRLINEELRANSRFSGPVNFMAGAYYEYSLRRFDNFPDILNIFNPLAQNYTTVSAYTDNLAESESVFGQVRWDIVPSLELAGGARYTHDEKHSALVNEMDNPAASLLGIILYPDNVVLPAHYGDNNVSPEVTLTWKPAQGQMLYGAFKTGYKSGGISNAGYVTVGNTPSNVVFGPENTNGFEIGYKGDLLANTLRLDITAYRYDYNGLQVSAFEASTFSYSIENAARARTQGITGSGQWLVGEHLSFNGNIGYNRARYLSFPNAECYDGQTPAQGCVDGVQNLAGQPLNRAPNLTFKVGANYKVGFVAGSTADLSISGAYFSSYETSTEYDPGGIQSSFWLLDAAVNIIPASDKFELSLVGRNLTNSYYKIYEYQTPLGANTQYNATFNRPREVALEATYNF